MIDQLDEVCVDLFVPGVTPETLVSLVAGEIRQAMAQLDVQVKPKHARPKPTRTKTGTILMLLAALENRDVYIRECGFPVMRGPGDEIRLAGSPDELKASFDCGLFRVVVRYTIRKHPRFFNVRTVEWVQIERFYLDTGQSLVVPDEKESRWYRHPWWWVANYRPAPESDHFGSILQLQLNALTAPKDLVVVTYDAEGRTYKWVDDRLVMWLDARGRVIHD